MSAISVVFFFTDLSDHLPVFQITSSIKKVNDTHCEIKHRVMSKKTIPRLRQDLEIEDWSDVYDKTDPQEAYNNFYNKLFKLYEIMLLIKKYPG